ncbi:zinc ribbon domain-containing protein [Mesorhizobium sp.]
MRSAKVRVRTAQPRRWPLTTGRFASKTHTLVILTGRSSWPIRDASPTTPIDTRPATAARRARALLQGLAVCGQCGRRMTVRYSGPDSACPVYTKGHEA